MGDKGSLLPIPHPRDCRGQDFPLCSSILFYVDDQWWIKEEALTGGELKTEH